MSKIKEPGLYVGSAANNETTLGLLSGSVICGLNRRFFPMKL